VRQVEQRVADELGEPAPVGGRRVVQLRFEREDEAEPIDAAGDLAHAARRTPKPAGRCSKNTGTPRRLARLARNRLNSG